MIMKVVTIHTKVSIRATCCSPGWTMILYTHRRCLEVALFGRHNRTQECLLLGEGRKSQLRRLTSESDPSRHGLEVCILFPSAVTYFEINSD
jgi:hypothetical protein